MTGRKSKYNSSFCAQIIDFFNVEHTIQKKIVACDKDGNTKIRFEEAPNILPTFEKFAVNIGVCVDTLNEWCKVHKEFSEAYKKCKNLQKDMLNDLALRGFYNPTYTIFVAKNITDMRDKQEIHNSGSSNIVVNLNRKPVAMQN
ncbi:MAG: hypothetical protein ACLSWI_01620 [Candidatus Gastranaerophilaceae bacterium]